MLPREHYLKQAFLDSAHFPNGFEKGGLSDIQARLVRKNGTLISALCIDEVSDPTSEDLHILKVIANQSSPKNPVEQAWVKYLSLVKNMAAATPKGKSKAKAAKPAVEEPTPEPTTAAEKAPIAAKAQPKATTKKAEPAPIDVKTKAAEKKEKTEPVAAKIAEKKVAPPKKEVKKTEVKIEAKKPTPKKAEPTAEAKKAVVKKPTKIK
jgi:uncharacterized protein YifE (UPF0438 family)